MVVIIWRMLIEGKEFDAASMAELKVLPEQKGRVGHKKTGVAGRKRKKAGQRLVRWLTFCRRSKDEIECLFGFTDGGFVHGHGICFSC
jgi:hypothetical protein